MRRRGVQDLAITMAVAESLVEYEREDFSKPKPQTRDNYAKGVRDIGSQRYTPKKRSSKDPNGKYGKGKDKRKEFTSMTNSFLRDGPNRV